MPWPTKLHAREEIIASARRSLADPETRVISLTGLPGVGTTSVARAVVTQSEQALQIPLVDARRARQPGALARLVQEAAALSDLVVIDDADHAPDVHAALLEVLVAQPSVQLIVTARAPLQLPGEVVVRVLPLPEPDCTAPTEECAEEPAVRLFVDAAVRAGAVTDLEGPVLRDVAAICAALGGVPLAIVLAAARTPTLSPTDLRDLLERSTPSAVISGPSAGRGYDLFSAIAWSESLLDEEARALLADLAVFRSAVQLRGIEEVSGRSDFVDSLAALVDTHLVEPMHEPGASQYRLHPLVREHAAHLLGRDPARADEVRTRHTRWAVGVAERSLALHAGGRPSAALGLVTPVEPDLVAALKRAVRANDAVTASQLVLGLAPCWFNRAATPAELGLLQQVLSLTDSQPIEPADRAMLLAWRGFLGIALARDAEHVAAALPDLHAAREIAAQVGGAVHVRVLFLTVLASRVMGDRSAIEPLCAQGRDLARALDDQASLATFEAWSGMLAHQRGHVKEALRWGLAAYERARRADDPQVLLAPAGLLRTLPPGTPGITGAGSEIPTFDQLLDIARSCGDVRSLAWLLPGAAVVALHDGDQATANRLNVESLRRTRASGNPRQGMIPMLGVILVAQDRGDHGLATRLRHALRPFREVLEPSLPPWAARAYGDRLFGGSTPGPSGSGPTPFGGEGAMTAVHEALDLALDYSQSLGAAPVIRLAEPLTDAGLPRPRPEDLTEREREVLGLLASGASNKELSKQLGISTKTVMHHTSSIYRKLAVRGRSEAVAWVLRHHLAELPDGELASGH